jgi:general secretion pathway protein M
MNSQELKAALAERFAALNEREQQLVRFGAWAAALLLVWWLAVQPAWRTLTRTPAELDRVERQLQDMQGQAQEVRELRAVPAVSGPQALEALQAATARLGGLATLNVNNGRAVLTLKGVGSEALQAWLVEARHAARAQPVEAQLQRGAGGYLGSITLALPGTAS